MLYRLDKKNLKYVKIKWQAFAILGLLTTTIIILSMGYAIKKKVDKDTEKEVLVILAKQNEFNVDKFISVIKNRNFPFPYIVYAQAVLETNNFTSKIFIENHNLFGMKEAVKRINTAKGTQFQHAYYDNWVESIYDYGYYVSTYLSDLKTESDYFDYLAKYYAEDKSYVDKLKSIINKDNLKEKFGF
jgi:uncharacterized FlgJ-related protein